MTLMRGPHTVRYALQQFLKSDLPQKINEAQLEWGISYTIPQFSDVLPYEPVRIPHGTEPLLAISLGQARNFTRYGLTERGEERYEVIYSCRLFMYGFTPEEHRGGDSTATTLATLRLRDDLAGIVRATLLGNPMMDVDSGMRIEETSLTESYSDIEQTSNQGILIAAAFFEFEIMFHEDQYYDIYGNVPVGGVELEMFAIPDDYYTLGGPTP